MCNNYALSVTPTGLADAFREQRIPWTEPEATPNLEPNDDIRPTDLAPVITAPASGGASLIRLKWGLLPSQPKRPPIINFRSEGRSFERGRCLVPASSFFEFTGTRYPKTRWRFSRTDGDWFCFAGMIGGSGDDARFTLLTREPGADIAPIHDRQPVVVERAGWAGWLSGGTAGDALQPSAAGTWTVAEAPRGKAADSLL